jgi:hypothetical protein
MSKTKKNLSPEVRAFFAEIGHRNGTKLKQERGSEYFRAIRAQRKNYPKQNREKDSQEALDGGNQS